MPATVAVIGGGPAGLRAAEVASGAGLRVTVFDAKPSVGRKFLVAGKGGMNLTHDEPAVGFLGRYRSSDDTAESPGEATRARWTGLLEGFDAHALREWALGLGVETFAAGTGRVYPREMKSAPLLRRWVARLRSAGVEFRMRHRWMGLRREGGLELAFSEDGAASQWVPADMAVLALGGASWPETGSNGEWCGMLASLGVGVRPLHASNCGWECAWPESVLARCEGRPLKNVAAVAGRVRARGELMVTRYGLEGGIAYALSAALRELREPVLYIDFKPDSAEETLVKRLGSARRDFLEEACTRWRLGETASGLLLGLRGGQPFADGSEVAAWVKRCPVPLLGPRPIAEAISSAGGVCFSEVDEDLMLRRLPGVFVAGEMLDWEAPTGGYLLQGCFATGTRAGEGVVRRAGVGPHAFLPGQPI